MKRIPGNPALLSVMVLLLAVIASGIGLFWDEGGSAFWFTSVRGEQVEMFGRGVYRFESLLIGAGHRGVDAVVLLVGVPLLSVSIRLYLRGSLRGRIMLLGSLAYFLYVYATLALGASYSNLFLLYVAIFSASLYALILTALTIDRGDFASHLPVDPPRRSLAGLMLATGALTAVLRLEGPVGALISGRWPQLHGSTTLVTHALDLGVIVPAFFLSGVMILRNSALGYLLALPLLFILAMLVPGVTAMTLSQLWAGVELTAGEITGFVAGFAVLGGFAVWALVVLLKGIPARQRQ